MPLLSLQYLIMCNSSNGTFSSFFYSSYTSSFILSSYSAFYASIMINKCQKQSLGVFYEKSVFKHLAKFLEKYLCFSLFFRLRHRFFKFILPKTEFQINWRFWRYFGQKLKVASIFQRNDLGVLQKTSLSQSTTLYLQQFLYFSIQLIKCQSRHHIGTSQSICSTFNWFCSAFKQLSCCKRTLWP